MNRRTSLGVAASVLGGIALAACTNAGSPSTPPSATSASATVQAVQPTAQAAATQARPTIQALATQAAPTVQAAQTLIVPLSATISASAPIHITNVQTSSTDSTVMLQNTSPTAVDLTGWQLQVGGASAALPSGMTIAPGTTVTLHTGSGTSTPTDVYLGPQAQNLSTNLKPGAQVVLQSPSGPVTAFNVPAA